MNDLDELLRNWNERNEPFEAHFAELRRQVVSKLTSSDTTTAPASVTHRRAVGIPQHRGGLAIALVVAASIFLAIGITTAPQFFEKPLSSSDPIQLVESSTESSQSLFLELERLFDGRWQSLSEINGIVQLQTNELDSASSEPGVAVRLTVMKRRSPREDWTIVWDASIISHTNEWVQLPKDSSSENSFSVWSHSLPDGSVLVESEMALTKPISVQLAEPTIITNPSQPTRLWSGQQPEGEFQLIQSVSRLKAHRG